MEDPTPNITDKQKKIALATSEFAPILLSLLNDCRTPIVTILAEDQFKTTVNALRLEFETEFIQRVGVHLSEIRKGKLHE